MWFHNLTIILKWRKNHVKNTVKSVQNTDTGIETVINTFYIQKINDTMKEITELINVGNNREKCHSHNRSFIRYWCSCCNISCDEAAQQMKVNICVFLIEKCCVTSYEKGKEQTYYQLFLTTWKELFSAKRWYHTSKHILEGWIDFLRMEAEVSESMWSS